MRYYHGTTLENAKRIKEVGLMPLAEKKFKTITPNGKRFVDIDPPGDVYLTRVKDVAGMFATFRAEYERAREGDIIAFPTFPDWQYTKYGMEREPKAVAAVVELDLPDEFPVDIDPQLPWAGYVYKGSIEPAYVKSIEVSHDAQL